MNNELRALCLAETDTLLQTFGTYNPQGNYSFIDNGSNVLAICHLDVVDDYYGRAVEPRKYQEYPINSKKDAKYWKVEAPHGKPYTVAETIALDDRLGLYILLVLLPRLGIHPDILLTTEEEIGRPTGENFKPAKQYNWMFQFDRHGTGLVMYQYEDPETVQMMKGFGYQVERGTFSDIAVLEFLGVKGFNFGTAYHYEHSEWCYCNLTEVKDQADKFAAFWYAMKDTRLPHTPRPLASYSRADYSSKFYLGNGQDDWDKWEKYNIVEEAYCSSCGLIFPTDELTNGLCWDCLYTLYDQETTDMMVDDPEFFATEDGQEDKEYIHFYKSSDDGKFYRIKDDPTSDCEDDEDCNESF